MGLEIHTTCKPYLALRPEVQNHCPIANRPHSLIHNTGSHFQINLTGPTDVDMRKHLLQYEIIRYLLV